MQPKSHDAYRRKSVSDQWADQMRARPDVYEEQEDQWAVLRHEVEEERMQKDKRVRSGWEQRDTSEDTISSQSTYDDLALATHNVDIVVVGVGGGGMNAINRMIATHVRGVRFVAMNTDAQVLSLSHAPNRICLGQHHTKGLGAGGNAAVGMRAATESATEIRAALEGADLVFVAAGMGGGTGTGAAPIVASVAKKMGALTVGIVTLPFAFEGTRRRRVAEQGIAELRTEIDALITVPNDRLLTTVARDYNLTDAFKIADDVLRQGVQGIAEVINVPGLINVDFADVRSVLREAGTALMSIGGGQGRSRAQQAADEAIAGGFLNVTIRGAKRVLFNISGGEDMTLFEVNEVAERIGQAIDDAADITFGAVIDPSLKDMLRVTLIAAGMETAQQTARQTMGYQTMSQIEHPSHTGRTSSAGSTNSQYVQRSDVAPVTPITPRLLPPRPGNSNPNVAPPVNAPPPTRMPPPVRPAVPEAPPVRQQRSLSDLRGIRSLGRRQETQKGKQADEENGKGIDVPPFLKRYEQ